ncbi:hypothetical protein ACFFN0_15640, partial [Ornithinimicrobium kibberense]
ATTLTHTDPHGRRRWGPPPTSPDPTTSADAPARPQPEQLPKLNIPTQPDNAPTPHDDPGHDDTDPGDTPWDKRTYGPPPF